MSSSGGSDGDPVAAGGEVSERWAAWRAEVSLDEYEARWDRQARAGQAVHGEADLVASFARQPVLDAGCGTGRVAIELARRGFDVVGVDLDATMLELARRKAPDLEWVLADLAHLDLGRKFAVVAMAGNIMIFVRPEDRDRVVAAVARHLDPGGLLVAGFTLEADGLRLDEYDALCAAAGLQLRHRWGTWEQGPFDPAGDYHVSVHERVG
jgi:SAM-dependent methyltransferase